MSTAFLTWVSEVTMLWAFFHWESRCFRHWTRAVMSVLVLQMIHGMNTGLTFKVCNREDLWVLYFLVSSRFWIHRTIYEDLIIASVTISQRDFWLISKLLIGSWWKSDQDFFVPLIFNTTKTVPLAPETVHAVDLLWREPIAISSDLLQWLFTDPT